MSVDGGGTEADGEMRSLKFCSRCYSGGSFKEPLSTVEEMIEKTRVRLLSLGMSEPVVEKYLASVYHLDRWATR
jgi:Putative zinc ribbon domain